MRDSPARARLAAGRRQRVDDAAFRNRAATALVDQAVELGLQRLQIPDLSLYFGAVRGRDRVDGSARPVAFISEFEQLAHLFK